MNKATIVSNFKKSSFNEEEARQLFVAFCTRSDDYLDRSSIRSLLFSIQQAYGGPLCIPEECLDRVLNELQLDAEFPDRVSWQDFKSFFVYLVQRPLEQLHGIVQEVLFKENEVDLTRCLRLKTSAPSSSEVEQEIANICKPLRIFSSCGQLLLFVEEEVDDQLITKFKALKGISEVVRYNGEVRFPESNVSGISQMLAKTILMGKKTIHNKHIEEGVGKISKFDQEMGISKGMSRLGKETSEAFVGFDERMGVSSTIKGVSKDVDEKLGISRGVEKLLENEDVKKGMDMVGGWFSSMKDSISKVRDETFDLVDSSSVPCDVAGVSGAMAAVSLSDDTNKECKDTAHNDNVSDEDREDDEEDDFYTERVLIDDGDNVVFDLSDELDEGEDEDEDEEGKEEVQEEQEQ